MMPLLCPFHKFISTLLLCWFALQANSLQAANQDGAVDLGVDYAFMLLMTLSPDFAAANYIIEDGDSDVSIAIGRLPYHMELSQDAFSRLQLEIAVAYQNTAEIVSSFSLPDEYIDARWNTYGIGLGLLYEYALTDQLRLTPSARAGMAELKNRADYYGVLTSQVIDQLDGVYFNWDTRAAMLNLGVGVNYRWLILDRDSSVSADLYHVYIDSFQESHPSLSFSEHANMLTVKTDMIFPTDMHLLGRRLDFVLLLGANEFFGDNRNTLGYTTSYQVGIGWELPMKWSQVLKGHLRMSGQLLWADNMNGWMLTLGYMPE